jgi:ABC-type uncharacterized transport system permease subunit
LGGWLLHDQKDRASKFVLPLLALALLAHAAFLTHTIHGIGGLNLSIGQTASLIGLAIAMSAAVGLLGTRGKLLAGLALVFAAVLTLATGVGTAKISSGDAGWPLVAHIVLSVVAYTLLAIAALTAAVLYRRDLQMRRHRKPVVGRFSLPLETLESQLFATIGAGFIMLTLAIFSGLFYVEDMFAQHLVHKTLLTIASWVLFAILLIGRWRFGWRARTAARWTIGGFAVLGLAYFGSRFVLEVLLERHWG